MLFQNHFFRLAVVMALMLGSWSAQAEIRSAEEAINVAGRQRMLSQRMVKAWLLVGQEVAVERARRQLDESVALFEEQLSDLEDYIARHKLDTHIRETRSLWNGFRVALLQAPRRDQAGALIENGEQLLKSANQVVTDLEQTPQGEAERLKIINLSGRQRMLSQRIALYYSALAWKAGDAQVNRERLDQAVSLYESSLNTLVDSHLNTPEIRAQLARVADHWKFSKAGFQLMESQAFVPFVIQSTTESMLKRMEAITGLYTGTSGQSR
ncbi:type IV pili methyl-accepting chemotaxis transducer N-terminal domain-containing protein [Hahella sp. SMD15-11]|uniref:Type IV pili methyl-accepting chemotaxis transducer N-terminal domain-containing protein n=1 Tax=Thermohahella caldifontis TaxID=3142973 RepID=A0AB39UU40_9GAMM